MTLPFTAGLSYLNQLSKEDFRKPHHTQIINGHHSISAGRHLGIGREQLPGRSTPAANSYDNSTIAAESQWPHIPHATLQFGAYVYEDFVHGRTDEKIPVRFFQIFFHLEDNTVKIMEQLGDRSEMLQGRTLSRQRVPRQDNKDLFLTVYDFAVGKSVVIYGRNYIIYCCDLYTRKVLTRMGFEVIEDLKPPYSQQMATSHIKTAVEKIERHFNEDAHLPRFLQYDRQVLRFDGLWDDTKSMFGDRHPLLIHFYLADGTMELYRKTQKQNGRPGWVPFIHRSVIPKKTSDLERVHAGTPWPVLKTMPNARHPIKNYQLFDQATYPDPPEVFEETDFETGKSVCIFGRTIHLVDCDPFTKWYYNHKYGKDLQAFTAPEDPKKQSQSKVCPYNEHGSEEDSIRNCQKLMPTPLVHDARRYLLMDQDPEDPVSLTFKAKMMTENRDDSNRVFLMEYSLNDGSICMKEKEEATDYIPVYVLVFLFSSPGRWIGTFLVKRPVKSGHNVQTTLPEYLAPEDLYVGALVELKGRVFVVAAADDSTLNYMEKYKEKFPYSDIAKVMEKFKEVAQRENKTDLADLRRELKELDVNKDESVDWDPFVNILMTLGKSSLTPHEYNTVARNYFFYPHIDRTKRRDLLRTHMQQALRQHLWEPRRNLLSALVKVDVHGTGFVTREEMSRTIKATKMPVKPVLAAAYLDLLDEVGADGRVEIEAVVRDLDWVRNPGVAFPVIPQKMEADFDYNKFFKEDQRKIHYLNFLKDLENAYVHIVL